MSKTFQGLRASELVQWLNQMIEKYGNYRVFSMCDYDTVGLVELFPPGEICVMDEPLFVLSWSSVVPRRNADGSFVLYASEEE